MTKEDKPDTARITIRLTEREQKRLKAEAAGTSVSAHVRACVFGSGPKRTKLRMPQHNEVLLAQLLAKLGQSRLSSNLNQLAKAIHMGVLPVTPETEADITEACAAVIAMRRDLLVALGLSGSERP